MHNPFGQTEQRESALKDLSIMIRKYYDNLIEQEFSEEQALTIALGWQASILTFKAD